MEKIYSYEFSVKDLKKMQDDIKKISKVISSQDFKKYVAEKLEEALQFLQRTNIRNISEGIMPEELSVYMNSNHLEIEGDTVKIYNDAMIDISAKASNRKSKTDYSKYENGELSLSKIIEYGIGVIGKGTKPSKEVEDWKYDVNNHQDKGWYYRDDNGIVHWTKGYQGKMIFYQLKLFAQTHIENWIMDYINEKL